MIRMVEMSVRFGIQSHGLWGPGIRHKKRARKPRVPVRPRRDQSSRASGSLDQFPQGGKGFERPINGQFHAACRRSRRTSSDRASAAPTLKPPTQPRLVGPSVESTIPPRAPPIAKPKYMKEELSDRATVAACGSIRMMPAAWAGKKHQPQIAQPK